MFLALKNGLGRLAVFFRGLFDEYGGAAAAYSLRRLGSAYSGPLVRVRRDSDDAELDFTSTTSIEDWVNGKLETTLPADVATSSAAYSLRKVKAGYTGDAVRIRRASDDVEVDVAFDTNGAVSASSAITNVTESPDQGDTTATTLGGFLTEGGNQDAYVQTWYDQSVNSNHATQDVAGNQPKIAEAGALLADGIDFDGIDDVLGFTEIPLSSSYAMFGVFDNSALPSDFIARSAITSNSYISLQPDGDIYWETDTNNDGIVNVNTGTPASGTNLLSCLLAASGTGTAFLNGTSGASASFANTNLTVNQLGGRGTTIFNEAQFKEIIIYNSDQSSNRFKIESNINNYYGIYDDANEFDSSETEFRFLGERSGGVSAVNGFESFTLDVQTAAAYAGAALKSDVPSGDSLYVSFYASIDEGANTASPKLTLKDVSSALEGPLKSNIYDVTAGFNSVVLTSTGSDANGLVFSEGDDDAIFTISNLRISYVSRNGFVHTWYDQSGNGYDATQTANDDQPTIVNAGSLLADGIDFDGVDDFFTASGVSTTQPYSVFMKIKASETGAVQQIFDSGSVDPAFFQFSTAGVLSINNPTSTVTSLDLTSTPTDVLISGFIDDPKTAFANGASILSPASGTGTNSLSGLTIGKHRSLSSNYYGGNFSELIIYDSDQSANRSGIESNIADHYGITLP